MTFQKIFMFATVVAVGVGAFGVTVEHYRPDVYDALTR